MNYTRKFTSDQDDALDLVQDTILKALTQKEKFINNVNLKGWLFTIMRNTFINKYRKEVKSKTTISTTLDYDYLNAKEAHTFNLPFDTLNYKEIQASVDTIGDKYLAPMQLYIQGYKYTEIADMLHLPLGTVKVRIFNARKMIKKNLQDK
jgi:RNA polymerase sigma-70 factor (ECF subfamily)